jgi:hypothetical protein
MDERPFPHGPLAQPPPSRRGFVVAGGLAVIAAAGGVAIALNTGGSDALPTQQMPPALTDAATAEESLIAQVDAALARAGGTRRAALRAIRADHVAHLAAIRASIADALYPITPSAAPSGSPSGARPARVSVAQVRAGEQQASRTAAARAAQLTGRPAVLLASIAAAEATHAELLS